MDPVCPASSLHGGKNALLVFVLQFCGTANERDHSLGLWSVRSLSPTGLLQDFLYPQLRSRVESVVMAKLVARYRRKDNQLLSIQGFKMQTTPKNPRN